MNKYRVLNRLLVINILSGGINMLIRLIMISILLALGPLAYCKSELGCGDVFRIETREGSIFQGKLKYNNGDSLSISGMSFLKANSALSYGARGSYTIAVTDVTKLYRGKRKTWKGTLIGAAVGTAVGYVVELVDIVQNPDWLFGSEKNAQPNGQIIYGGIIIGAVIGGIIGHNSFWFNRVQLEMLPICLSSSDDLQTMKVNLTINF
jgi:hypothetical protein